MSTWSTGSNGFIGRAANRHDRRSFLRLLAGAMSATGVAGPVAAASAGCARSPRLDALGIQLYTLRSLMEQDVAGTLEAIAGIGYSEVELAGLYGKTAGEMRSALDAVGLRAVSGHYPVQQLRAALSPLLESASTLGHQYIVVPWLDEAERTADGYRRLAETLNSAGDQAQAAGMRIGYHNHDFEFEPVGDTIGYDILLEQTDPRLVDMELDIFWIVNGGRDPLAYFAAHPGRFPLLHLKDRTASGTMVDVGAGAIDFAAVLREGDRTGGVRHGFVEHDNPTSPIESARASYAHLSRLRG